jgi:hypothetical protein
MDKKHRARNRLASPMLQMTMALPIRERNMDPKTRAEVLGLLARLLLNAVAQRGGDEVNDDAP